MPAAAAGVPSSTPRTRTPSRSGSPTERRSRRATWVGAMATPRRRATGDSPRPSAVDPGAQGGVGRQRQVEALADAVRVEADQPAGGVDERAARRARRERRRVLEAAVDPPAARAAEGARHGRHEAEGDARPAAVGGRRAEDRGADGRRGTIAPTRSESRRSCRRSMTARSPSASTPGTVPAGRRPSANVTVTSSPRRLWALVRTCAVGDDDARAARAAADADDGRSTSPATEATAAGVLRWRSWWGLRYWRLGRLVTCNLLLTSRRDKPRPPPYHRSCGHARTPSRPRRSARSRHALDRVGDRWSLLLVEALLDGPRRFNELADALPGSPRTS